MKTKNIEILFNTSTVEVKGDGQLVSSILVKNNISGKLEEIPATGFFVAIGHKPNTDIFSPFIEMDETCYIINKPGSTKTNIEGVFVSGGSQYVYRPDTSLGFAQKLYRPRDLEAAQRPQCYGHFALANHFTGARD